jgi:hypothetical protein
MRVHVARRELFCNLFDHNGLPEPDEENKQKTVSRFFVLFMAEFKGRARKT